MDNNNKKRQRLDASLKVLGDSMETLTNMSQDTIMLSAGTSLERNIDLLEAGLPTNLYFTICDDISNDSHEYLAVESSSTAITKTKEPKRESNLCDQPLQYRFVSQVPKTVVKNANLSTSGTTAVSLHTVAIDGPTRCSTTVNPINTASLPATTAVQLPSGCEIYLVKEYVDSDEAGEIIFAEDCKEPTPLDHRTLTQNITINNNSMQTIMKSAPTVSILPSIKTEPGTHTQFLGNNVIASKVGNSPMKVNAASISSTYKKRDEKRRATHNEVERRRRDKINSWIFKLKEMLPTDSSGNLALKAKTNHTRNMSASNRLPADTDDVEKSQQPQHEMFRAGTSSRSPPNDSKSQILIKACEYIRAMQDEVKSLRECLMENEKLRTSNLRLQNELQQLKNSERRQQQQQECDDSFNRSNICSSPSDGFTLTLCTNGTTHSDDITSSSLFAASTTPTPSNSTALINGRKNSSSLPYTKRELIITDYVD